MQQQLRVMATMELIKIESPPLRTTSSNVVSGIYDLSFTGCFSHTENEGCICKTASQLKEMAQAQLYPLKYIAAEGSRCIQLQA
eukprot:6479899-Ditylum_brightwellii.AAC.1